MLRRVRFVVVVVVLCVGEVALLGAEAVEGLRPSGTADGREDVGFGELSEDPVPDSGLDAVDAVRSASRCSSTFDNGTPSDNSDDYELHSSRGFCRTGHVGVCTGGWSKLCGIRLRSRVLQR